MPDEEAVQAADGVHLEWWYDLDQPFLANVDLLTVRSHYATSLDAEDATYPATVHLPRRAETDSGLGNFLAPPRNWSTLPPGPDEQWGTHYRHPALGLTGIAIKRLAFTVHADSNQVPPAIRFEWGPDLLAQDILHHIDAWWENVKTWLEIATNQRLAQVGHEADDPLNPNTRTSIWSVNDDGTRRKSQIGGTILQGPARVQAVSAEILQDCLALAATTPPLAWTLLRDARALHDADQYRRAVIDAATAAELAATTLIDGLLAGTEPATRKKLIKGHQTLGGKRTLLEKLGFKLPDTFKKDLVERRNAAVHEGTDISHSECEAAFRDALTIVEKAFPLPTAPGAHVPLTCQWQLTKNGLPLSATPWRAP